MTTEEWRSLPEYPSLLVSSQGRFKKASSGEICKQNPVRTGHLRVWVKEERRHIYSHRLVALAWHGPPPADKPFIRHLDGSKTNNVPSNLRWGDASENALDRVVHGTDKESRKQECPKGHPYDGQNTGFSRSSDGRYTRRACKTCRAAGARERRRRERAAIAASSDPVAREEYYAKRRKRNREASKAACDRRQLIDGRLVAPDREGMHGSHLTYSYYGCRCDQCREGERVRKAARDGRNLSAGCDV